MFFDKLNTKWITWSYTFDHRSKYIYIVFVFIYILKEINIILFKLQLTKGQFKAMTSICNHHPF